MDEIESEIKKIDLKIDEIELKTAVEIDSTYKSDKECIQTNNMNPSMLDKRLESLRQLLERVTTNMPNPNSSDLHKLFRDNCLEYRLDRRRTTYNLDNVDNIKILLAVSGAGKTRLLLELFYVNFGYYFITKSSQDDFGSEDLALCQSLCDRWPELSSDRITLLYFARAGICNYLIGKGFKEPWQILLAQLHPVAFFGFDIFKLVYSTLLNDRDFIYLPKLEYFSFVAIDEIEAFLESDLVHRVHGTLCPFFSPLVYKSKMMYFFPHFIISGSDMNFKIVEDLTGSCCFKRGIVTAYHVISCSDFLSKQDVVMYATQFLQEHQVQEANDIVSRISLLKLCHGRPRFIAYILDTYMESKDIDVAISKFVSGISTVDGEMFPLKFLKRDLDNNADTLYRVFCDNTLFKIVHRALLDVIWKNRVRLFLPPKFCFAAIRYGLGFVESRDGILRLVEIQELAVTECLRNLIPFSYIIKSFTDGIMSNQYPSNPQTVGYLIEYLVAFTLVSNYSGIDAANSIKAFQGSVFQYLQSNDPSQVCFPEYMCGPDIIYKCTETKIVYIVQVEFEKGISKQETASAYDTTDPDLFYCNRKSNVALKGFEDKRLKLLESLRNLQVNGYSLQQLLFIHSGGNTSDYTRNATIISCGNTPDFFDKIGPNVWKFLDSIRQNLRSIRMTVSNLTLKSNAKITPAN